MIGRHGVELLERHHPVDDRVKGQVNDGHAALAQLADQLVTTHRPYDAVELGHELSLSTRTTDTDQRVRELRTCALP
jgi:putative NIF3 family GTP cyclohydrolase 1 type 2